MATWEFTHSVLTNASRMDAWLYWSDFRNHALMEPAIVSVEFDGPFATGATGRTTTKEFTQEWTLTEVIVGERFTITGVTADGAGALSFSWEFTDEGSRTRMTQRISAYGPDVANYMDVFRQMEAHAPEGMARLAVELDRLARESDPGC
jgi:hypothetical protein